jgi:hypothetical protein
VTALLRVPTPVSGSVDSAALTAWVILDEDDPRGSEPTLSKRSRWLSIRAMAFPILVLVLIAAFLVSAGTALRNDPASQATLALCPLGQDAYNNVATSSSSTVLMGPGEVLFQRNADESARWTATPYEWYGSVLPFTSVFKETGTIPDACGTADGPFGTIVPQLIFMFASAITTIVITVYTWATDPSLLNDLMKPIDCIIAGKNSLSPADLQLVGCQSEGLVKVLYLEYMIPIIGLGALWALWNGLVKRRSTQVLIGAGWMILVTTLGWVFLLQPTFLARTVNSFIGDLGNRITTTVTSNGVGTNDMCYLPIDGGIKIRDGIPVGTYDDALLVGPRRASCVLWKNFIYEAWVYGQFGSPTTAGSPGTFPIKDEAIRNSIRAKFPHLSAKAVNSLGLAQLDATILDHDEVIRTRAPQNRDDCSFDLNTGAWLCDDTLQANNEEQFWVVAEQIGEQQNAGWNQMWAGRTVSHRYAASVTAGVAAAIGGVVVFILGFLNVIYQIGLLLLILVAPLILLIGIHPGYGRRITLRWLEALVGTGTKRIVITFLLAIMVGVYGTINGMALGWLQKVLMLAAIGISVIMYRKQLTQMLSAINLGGGGGDSFNQGANQMSQRGGRTVTSMAGAAGAAALAGGGVGAVAAGAFQGASRGLSSGGMMGGLRTGQAAGRAAAARSRARQQQNQRANTP